MHPSSCSAAIAAAIHLIDCYFTPKLKNELLKWLRVSGCFLFALLVSPLFILLAIFVQLWRIFVTIHFKLVHEGKFKLCAPSDAAYSVESHANTLSIYAFGYVKGQSDIHRLRDRALSNLIGYTTKDGRQPYEKLTWKLLPMYGFNAWETENDSFDIRDHVKYCPGTDLRKTCTLQQVMENVEKFLDYTMDPKRPQWEILYVPKLHLSEQDDGQKAEEVGDDNLHYALILRVQHAYLDGVSLLQLLRFGLCDDPANLIIDPVNPPIPKISTFERIALYAQTFFMAPYTFYMASSFFTRNIFQKGRNNTGPKFIRSTNNLPTLKSVKHIREKFNCSTTALFNAVTTGALRQAAERKHLPIPENIDCVLTMAMLPYKNEDLQNRFTFKAVPLPISIPNPVKRLNKINSITKAIAPHEVLAVYCLTVLIGLLPVKLIRIIHSTMNMGYGVTNLPGFKDKLSIFGNSVEGIFGCPPIKNGLGFTVGLSSYNGAISACWMAEKSEVISTSQELELLIEDFEKEFAQLECIASENILQL